MPRKTRKTAPAHDGAATDLGITALAERGVVLDIRQNSAVLNVSVSQLRRWIKGQYFPAPVVLGPDDTAQIHRWPAHVVRHWMEEHGLLPPSDSPRPPMVVLPDGVSRPLSEAERCGEQPLPEGVRILDPKRGAAL